MFVNFFELFVQNVLISWHCDVNYEAGLCLVVNQRDVRPIVKQMLVSLDGEVPEDLGMIIPDYVFWYYSQCLLCSKLYSAHTALYINEATLLYLSVFSVPGSLLQPLMICATVSAYCLHNLHLDLGQCGRSRVPLFWR